MSFNVDIIKVCFIISIQYFDSPFFILYRFLSYNYRAKRFIDIVFDNNRCVLNLISTLSNGIADFVSSECKLNL